MDDALAVPRATYRLQFSKDFGFAEAAALVPYLASLGVSHVYASPLLMARPGSSHGYDIVNHNRLNPEYGDDNAFAFFISTLHHHGMGLILDIVPNHMGIGLDNPWWVDVLEWGQASPYASYFDIDWEPQDRTMHGKVLLPVLGDQYGVALERGELPLALDEGAGAFSITYFDRSFPIAPRSYPGLLGRAAADMDDETPLRTLIGAFHDCLKGARGIARRTARRAQVNVLKHQLADLLAESAETRASVHGMLAQINGRAGDAASFNALHRLLEGQAYRLAYWRVAAHEINYRRFFDINDLAGIRMEQPGLFEVSHRLIGRLLAEGQVQGLRLDHIDGLRSPKEYFERLQRLAEPAWKPARHRSAEGDERRGRFPLYVLVEKILASHEQLRRDWPVSGTTGYEFIALLNGAFVDPVGERAMTRFYRQFADYALSYADTVRACKRLVMRDMLAAEMNVLANIFFRLAKQSRRTRDYTRLGFREALEDVVTYFSVYRTYVSSHSVSAQDRRDIDWAVGQARKAARTPDKSIYDFIRDILTLDLVSAAGHGYRRRSVIDAALRFQQYTGPVMAKAAEDTAFYRYVRLVSLNEVGGDPSRFSAPLISFHDSNRDRLKHHPDSMLATATHDHKRGEDVRARLNVLSEVSREWSSRVGRWATLNARKKQVVDGCNVPTANEAYLFYQTLVGAWPLDLKPEGYEGLDAFRERIGSYMLKAVREAKQHTSWTAPDESHESSLLQFVDRVLNYEYNRPFLDNLHGFVERIAAAGAVNGLAQTLLKLTCPGVPDTYQGTELWDLSLVDPDNRRPVDYDERRRGLAQIGETRDVRTLCRTWRDGRIKQYVAHRALGERRDKPRLFADGAYQELNAAGPWSNNVMAFARSFGGHVVMVAVPRFVTQLEVDDRELAVRGWRQTALRIEGDAAQHARYRNCFTGEIVTRPSDGLLPVESLFAGFPVALLHSI